MNDTTAKGASAYAATLIAPPGSALISANLATGLAAALGARGEPVWLCPGEAADFILPEAMTQEQLRGKIATVTGGLPLDCILQPVAQRRRQVLLADMDSTMIDQECIDELAAEIGLKEKVAAITARAMNGEIEFEPALRERVALLAGIEEAIIDTIIDKRITLASGGATLIATMKHHGGYCVLVSGGFTVFTSRIAAMLGFDENHANILEVEAGRLTGKVREPILGKLAKVETLDAVTRQRGLDAQSVIAVGDGANDLDMLQAAGTGIALHAKPSVAAAAPHRVDHGDLTALLYAQGYRREQFATP